MSTASTQETPALPTAEYSGSLSAGSRIGPYEIAEFIGGRYGRSLPGARSESRSDRGAQTPAARARGLVSSIAKSGGELRVNAQLVDANSDENRWAHGFIRNARRILSVQTEIDRDCDRGLPGDPGTITVVHGRRPVFKLRPRLPDEEGCMTTTITSAEQWLRDSVVRQLGADPSFDASMIGVTSSDGVVTLSGYVDTYFARLAAERAARRVYGVKAVANELEVKLAQDRIDPDIAKDALQALKNRVDVPTGLAVTVRDGYVSLTGKVEWKYQKEAAERAIRYLRGVRGVFNNIELKPQVAPKDVQRRITEALHRHAAIDARRIHVEASGGTVTLDGNVRSWGERDEAERAAWTVSGVANVINRIGIVP